MGITRRQFCALAALSAAAAPLRTFGVTAEYGGQRLKVTVVRRCCLTDVQSAMLEEPETGLCTAFAEGQEFVGINCPAGFCVLAWHAIERCVDAGGCSAGRNGTILVSCPDGTRPVVFKVERV